MHKYTTGSLLLSLSLLLSACSWGPVVTIPPDWKYEKDAITLHVQADPNLNAFQRSSHALHLCVYHLRDLNAFNQLLNENGGLPTLLECSRFDPAVVLARQLIIQPGQELTETMDRADGVRFVNIAAGYYNLKKETVVRSYPVPLHQEKRRGNLIQTARKLDIDLRLGPKAIEEVPAVEDTVKEQ